MIGLIGVQSGAQDAQSAPAARRRERRDAVRPAGRVVCAGAALHVYDAAEDLFGRNEIAFDLVVASDEKARAFRRCGPAVQAMRNEAVGGRRVENDIAGVKILFADRFHGEKIAVAHEGRHARPARREADGAAFGKEIAGQATEERRGEIEGFCIHGLRVKKG